MSDWESEFGGDVLLYKDVPGRSRIAEDRWVTKDGRQIPIKDMADAHLLNAYKRFQDKRLFNEMVVRLFEARVNKGSI
jgi:hypothetical protein